MCTVTLNTSHNLWLLIMRSRVRFPALPWEFSLKGRIPAVTMVWVDWYNLGLRALLALHPPISPLTSSGQRNCASWACQPQKSVTLLSCPGGRTTKSTRTCGGNGQKKKYLQDYAESNILLMDTSHFINCNIILDTKLCSFFDYSEKQKGSSSLYSKDTESNLGWNFSYDDPALHASFHPSRKYLN
jgi:hypothetical protein